MQTMTRAEAADKLIDRYAGYFDISPAQEEQAPLVATCDFHAHSEKYVLSRKAKLWEAGSHEYVYLFSVPHLTEDIYNSCRTMPWSMAWLRWSRVPPICTATSPRCSCVTAATRQQKKLCGNAASIRASKWPFGGGWISTRAWRCWRKEKHFPTPAEKVQHSF